MNGYLSSLGFYDFGGELQEHMTAHPRKDPENGDLIFFYYDVFSPPYSTLFLTKPKSKHLKRLPIHGQTRGCMMHDFAITEHYAILFDLNLVFSLENVIKSMFKFRPAFTFDSTTPARFGFVRRKDIGEEYRDNSVQWFNAKPCFMFHSLNAWERKNSKGEDEVVLIGCRVDSFDLTSSINTFKPQVYRWTFNMATGRTQEGPVLCLPASGESTKPSPVAGDFPVHNTRCTGRQSRYGYFTTLITGDDYQPDQSNGLVKIDFQAKPHPVATTFMYNQGEYGGECSFVPSTTTDDEDDGFLVTFTTHMLTGKSKLWVLSAKTMLVCSVIHIPSRIPMGFHGMWLSEKDMEHQAKLD
jgi:carotenoid cleavage dioxygenase